MTTALLAIDAGTTGVTALVIDITGRVAATGYREFPQHFPAAGQVEHDLDEIWSATLAATAQALGPGGQGPADAEIAAVGITNQRETVAFWDRRTLAAPRRAIVWQDRRTAPDCQTLRDAGHEPAVTQATGLRLDPYFSATKLAWVRDHDPSTWSQIVAGQVAVGTIDSYLIARMTAGAAHVTDATNASRTLLYDLATGAWSPDLCALFGVPIDALPTIVPSFGEVAVTDPAAFLGIAAPICAVAGDQQAALVGQGGFTAGATKCTYGTGSFLLTHTGTQPARSPHGLLTTVALQAPDGSRTFALEGSVFIAGAAVQWLRDGLGLIESAPQIESLAAQVPDSGGVVFVPALTGLGAPDWDPDARGLIIGITRGTTSAHLARATLDSIALQVADVVRLMVAATGQDLPVLAVDGGAAANNLLCQIQADVLQARIERPMNLQSTGLGAGYLAGIGAGVWTSFDEVRDLRSVAARFEPQSAGPDQDLWRAAITRARAWASVVDVGE